ncbi:MAG TPA: PKD domain-containing protein [Gemmatimonadaceae bacterium]
MRLAGRSLRTASAIGRPSTSARAVVRAVGVLAIVTGAACQDVTPTLPPNRIAPGKPALVLTGGTGTNLFPIADPGNQQTIGYALGLNSGGQVTGAWQPANYYGGDARVFRWSAATGATLVSATCCGGDQFGIDINDAGVITGQSFGQGIDAKRAFRATGDTIVNLPTLPATIPSQVQAQGLAINNAGQIAGWSSQGGGFPNHAVIWSPSDVIQDLGTLGGTHSKAVDINNAGQVIGWSQTSGDAATHYFSWTASGGMVDLNVTIDANITSVVEINDAGQISGTYVAPSGQSHAFLYTPSSGLLDLGTLGGATSAPTGLNNKGNVVGSSTLADGSTHAFLWTQTDGMEDISNVAGVPEVKRLNDNLQTLTGTQNYGMPRLVQLTVTQGGNKPPVARFTVNCVGQSNPTQCAFDASGSTDDAGIVSYKWDWGNGRGETWSIPTVRNTWASPGVYTVTLTVSDAGGLSGTTSMRVQVGPNKPPTVQMYPGYGQGGTFQQGPIDFKAIGMDPEDGVIPNPGYSWTSSIDGFLGTGSSITVSTLSLGTHTITVTVTDSKGATASTSITVTVIPPKASFTWTCSGQALPHQCAFDASASTDPAGIVSYKWDWGNGRSETHTTPTVRNTWASAGTYTVTLVVTNGLGDMTVKVQQVAVP